MPQLDIDLYEDFLFFAYVALLFGFGDEDTENAVIFQGVDSYLALFFLTSYKRLNFQQKILKSIFVFNDK